VARRFLVNEHDAQDALQDALLSAFRAISTFEGESRLATWLHRITVNACLMKLRSQKRSGERPIEELLPTYVSDGHRVDAPGRWSVTIDTAIQSHETCEMVRSCIDRLPESYRTVLLLRDIDERSTEETASLLGIETGAVKTRLHRARQALRTLLDPYMRGGEA
jgi:RNA polymerase sigma-70 factor (ECF subfamily)